MHDKIEFCIELGYKVQILLTRDRYIVFYESMDYSKDLLNVLYDLMSPYQIGRMVVIFHGIYAKEVYSKAREGIKLTCQDTVLHCNVSAIDISQIQKLAKVLSIDKIRILDRMEYFCDLELNNTCIVEQEGAVLVPITITNAVQSIQKCTRNNLFQTLNVIAHKYNILQFKEVNDVYDSKYLFFENYDLDSHRAIRGFLSLCGYAMLSENAWDAISNTVDTEHESCVSLAEEDMPIEKDSTVLKKDDSHSKSKKRKENDRDTIAYKITKLISVILVLSCLLGNVTGLFLTSQLNKSRPKLEVNKQIIMSLKNTIEYQNACKAVKSNGYNVLRGLDIITRYASVNEAVIERNDFQCEAVFKDKNSVKKCTALLEGVSAKDLSIEKLRESHGKIVYRFAILFK